MKFSQFSLKNLIVPVEIQIREFDAKLLLSCFAVEQGFKVFIGNKYEIHKAIDLLPPAIYLGKGLRSPSVYELNKSFFNPVVAWDEEGLVYYSPEIYLKRRISPETLALLDSVFAWGEDNASLINSVNYQKIPVYVTGNPRGDLLRPEFANFFAQETAQLKKEYGDFILINSNFAMVNGVMKKFTQLPLPSESPPQYEVARKLYNPDLAVHRHALFKHFLDLLKFMGENFPQHKIILRPHPSENYGPWQEIAELFPNILVIREGNVLPWLKACKLLIHNGCTTAVEGSLLGIEIIAYCPIASEGLDAELPNHLSLQATNLEQVKNLTNRLIMGEKITNLDPKVKEARAKLRSFHVANVENIFASEQIVQVLDKVASKIRNRRLSSLRYLKAKVIAVIKRLIKNRKYNLEEGRLSPIVRTNNFPPLSVEEVNRRIQQLSACLNGRFDNIQAKPSIKEGIFELSNASGSVN